jgi:hypothetical protein
MFDAQHGLSFGIYDERCEHPIRHGWYHYDGLMLFISDYRYGIRIAKYSYNSTGALCRITLHLAPWFFNGAVGKLTLASSGAPDRIDYWGPSHIVNITLCIEDGRVSEFTYNTLFERPGYLFADMPVYRTRSGYDAVNQLVKDAVLLQPRVIALADSARDAHKIGRRPIDGVSSSAHEIH